MKCQIGNACKGENDAALTVWHEDARRKVCTACAEHMDGYCTEHNVPKIRATLGDVYCQACEEESPLRLASNETEDGGQRSLAK